MASIFHVVTCQDIFYELAEISVMLQKKEKEKKNSNSVKNKIHKKLSFQRKWLNFKIMMMDVGYLNLKVTVSEMVG